VIAKNSQFVPSGGKTMNPYEPTAPTNEPVSTFNIDDPVLVQFDFNSDFWLQTLERYRSLSFANMVFRILRYAFLIMFLFMTITAGLVREQSSTFLFASCTVFLLFANPLKKWLLVRKFQKSPFCNQSFQITFTQEGKHSLSATQDSKSKWSAFTKMIRFEDGVLLMQGPGLCSWIPFSSIDGEDGAERPIQLLES